MPYAHQDIQVIVDDTLNKLSGYATQTVAHNCAVTSAACVIYNLDTKRYWLSGGSLRIWTAVSGSGGSMGVYRKYINSHPKLNKVGDKFRSGDAELKILDDLMTIKNWKKNNLIIIKVSQEPCKACRHAISNFAHKESQGVVAVCWPANSKLFGNVSKPAEESKTGLV